MTSSGPAFQECTGSCHENVPSRSCYHPICDRQMVWLPYARHYKQRLVYFFTPFPKTIYILWALALCMACIQEQLLIKSSLWWRAYGMVQNVTCQNMYNFFIDSYYLIFFHFKCCMLLKLVLFQMGFLKIDDYILSNKNCFRSKNYKQWSLHGEFFHFIEVEFGHHQASLLFLFS